LVGKQIMHMTFLNVQYWGTWFAQYHYQSSKYHFLLQFCQNFLNVEFINTHNW
jgi:hypothetical protein